MPKWIGPIISIFICYPHFLYTVANLYRFSRENQRNVKSAFNGFGEMEKRQELAIIRSFFAASCCQGWFIFSNYWFDNTNLSSSILSQSPFLLKSKFVCGKKEKNNYENKRIMAIYDECKSPTHTTKISTHNGLLCGLCHI